MTDLEPCCCGHIFDEHEPPECAVDDCDCIHFEAANSDESNAAIETYTTRLDDIADKPPAQP